MARRLTGRPAVPGRRSPSRVPGTHEARASSQMRMTCLPALGPGSQMCPLRRFFPDREGGRLWYPGSLSPWHKLGLPLPKATRTSAARASPWEGTLTFTEWRPWWRPRRGHPRGRQASGQQRTQADCRRGERAAGPRRVRKDRSRGCACRPGPAREPGPSLPPRDAE